MSKRDGVDISAAAHSILKACAKKHGRTTPEELAIILSRFDVIPATIKIVRSLRKRRVSLSVRVAESMRAQIEKAGGGVTLDEVADFILQAGGSAE